MKYFVYILESEKNGRFYIGQTQDVQERLKSHNKGYKVLYKDIVLSILQQ